MAINDCEKIAFYIWKKGDKYYEKVLCKQAGEKFTTFWKHELMRYRSTIIKTVYKMQPIEHKQKNLRKEKW